MQNRNHRQGLTEAGERVLRRAHARRLLLTLADITRRLGAQLPAPGVRAEYRAVERELRRLAGRKAS